jgi:hypothetical protein
MVARPGAVIMRAAAMASMVMILMVVIVRMGMRHGGILSAVAANVSAGIANYP